LDRTKVAIVGAGYLGRQHARIYSELGCAELVGVVDKNTQTAEAVAKEFRTNAYTDFHAVVGKVSAVSLAAPTTEHASLGCELLERGIDVLVEKPIASSLGEAEALIRAARAQLARSLISRCSLKFIDSVFLLRAAWISTSFST
jgi:predicted dehydrogenase